MSDGDEAPGDTIARVQALIDLRRYEEALRAAGLGLARAPGDPRLNCLSALALLRLGRNSAAVSAAGQALATDPTTEWAYRLMASASIAESRRSRGKARLLLAGDAVSAAQDAVRLAPTNYLAYVVLAEAKVASKDLIGADEAARRAIELAPESAAAWVSRSQVALAARDHEAGRQAAEAALALDPKSSAAHNNLGVAYLRLRRRREAAAEFVEAGRLDPASRPVHRNLLVTGTLVPRLVLVVALLPVLAIPRVGTSLYFVLLIGANVLLFRMPRLKTWATRRGIRKGTTSSSRSAPPSANQRSSATVPKFAAGAAALRPIQPRGAIATWVVATFALLAWIIALSTWIEVIAPEPGGTPASVAPIGVVFTSVAIFLTYAMTKHRGRRQHPNRPTP